MVQLGERQAGFHARKLGFPSIDGCMAIVVVLPEGLYGYHSYGGERSTDWPKIIPHFKSFIERKGGNLRQATRLYGITHVGRRGWEVGGVRKDRWKAELAEYATGLGLTCRTSGYDLDTGVAAGFHLANKSAYVEFEKFSEKCDVSVQTWENVNYTKLPSSHNPWGNDIKTIMGNALRDVNGDIYHPVTPTALTKIHKTMLKR